MTQPIRTRPSRRLVPWALAAGVAIGAVPAFASATPVKPTADCTVVGGKDGLIAYFGYDSPLSETTTIPVRSSGDSHNFFSPGNPNRGQVTEFAPGAHRGVFWVDAFPDEPVTWSLKTPGVAEPETATASISTRRCLPNLTIDIAGPPSVTAGETGTWTVTVTHAGYPDISPDLQPDVAIPVDQIVTRVPSISDTPLTPNSVPEGGLKPGDTLTYTVTGPVSCTATGMIDQNAVTGLKDAPEYTTEDNTDLVSTPVTGSCTVDLGVGITPNVPTTTPGNTVEWSVPVTNTGNTPVAIEDIRVISPGLVLTPAPGSPTGTLAPGQTITFTASTPVTPAQCGTLTNTVRVGYGSDSTPEPLRDSNPANDTAVGSVVVECTTTPVPPTTTTGEGSVCTRPSLMARVGAKRRVQAGQRTNVVLTARNRSGTPAVNTRLRYRIPAGMAMVKGPRTATVSRGVVTVKLGTLGPKKTRTIRLSLQVARTARASRVHVARLSAGCSGSAAGRLTTSVVPLQGQINPRVTG
ncbi:MAG: DUF11 domain-containing protein [Actinobacteria bacterium]|nr:DUF11 domain-containing protein [Actinomycetota bacterium]